MATENHSYPDVRVNRAAERRIESGHVWVFGNEVLDKLPAYTPGDCVIVRTEQGKRLGTGYINPNSLIAVRVLTRSADAIDELFFRERFSTALAWRKRVYPGLEVFRLVHGEADGLSGIVVDVYGATVAVQVLTVGMERLQPVWLPVLLELLKPKAVVARNDTSFREYEHLPQSVAVLAGDPSDLVSVEENGVQYAVSPCTGQKTGLFLDQKDNRQRLAAWADGASMLDAFCYVGGWSLSAAKAGATATTGIDSSEDAITAAARNAVLNGVADRCHFAKGDVFEEFRKLVDARQSFDIVVVDPPAFAKRKSQTQAAVRGYRDINTHAIKLVKPGGLLVTCSCSHHIGNEDFRGIIAQAGRAAGRNLRLVEARGAALDHPVLLAMRETEYLKCLFLLVT